MAYVSNRPDRGAFPYITCLLNAMAPRALAVSDDISVSSFSVKGIIKQESRNRPAVRRRHSITFSGENTVHEIDKSDDEEHEDIWYSKSEYDSIKAGNKVLVNMKKTGRFAESDENSFRGLEHKLKEGYNQRRTNKFNALNTVLTEQDRQYARGLLNMDSVAKKYEIAAVTARESAYSLGLQDADDCGIPVSTIDNDDDQSVVSDMNSVYSDDTTHKKMRIRNLFQGISAQNKTRSHRRASIS